MTQLLDEARRGNTDAQRQLFRQLYDELHRLAHSHLARSAPMTLIDASALIGEVYLRLGQKPDLPGSDRRAFLAYASRAMRSVIIDYVRARNADRRGGGQATLTLTTAVDGQSFTDPQLEALDDALHMLEKIDDRAHRIVEMRYFGGMEIEEIADFLAISVATVKRDWQKARAFLFHVLTASPAS